MSTRPATDEPARRTPEVLRCARGITIVRSSTAPERTGDAYRVGQSTSIARPDGPSVDAHRSDGVLWRRHWRQRERLVIEFVGLATVLVDHDLGSIVFDRHLAADVEDHLLLDHVVPLLLADRGSLVLHAAVTSWEGAGAVLVGASGAGKSTLAAYMWQRGWTLGNDDGTVLLPSNPPTAEPTYPTLRLWPSSTDLLDAHDARVSDVVGKHRLAGSGSSRFRPDAVRIAIIACLEPSGGTSACTEPLQGVDAHVELFGSMFHAGFSRPEVVAPVVAGLASIIDAVPVVRLTVPRGLEGLASAEHVLKNACGRES